MIRVLKNAYTYTYIAFEPRDRGAFIVDPAWNYGAIVGGTEDLSPRGILLTHHHFDHVNLADRLARDFDIPVFMTRAEIDYYGFRCRNLEGIAEDGPLRVDGMTVEAIATPGHTKGGACYLFERCLFSGDTVFIEGCGICDLAGGDPSEMFLSIQKLKRVVPNDVRVYPGHSYGKPPGETIASLRAGNIYFNIKSREQFVAFRMRKGQKGLLDFK